MVRFRHLHPAAASSRANFGIKAHLGSQPCSRNRTTLPVPGDAGQKIARDPPRFRPRKRRAGRATSAARRRPTPPQSSHTSLRVTDYRLSPPGLPPDFRLTISVVADLHAGGPNMGRERVRQVVDASNQLKSDLVVVLGDYFATHRFITEHVPPDVWAAELAPAQCAARCLVDLWQSRLVVRHRGHAPRLEGGAASGVGK